MSNKKRLETVGDIARQLQAVNELEYLNKNWLAFGTDPGMLNRQKAEKYREIMTQLDHVINELNTEMKIDLTGV